jgi:hypothetical protein
MYNESLVRNLAAVRAAASPALASRCDKAVALVLTGKVHLAGADHAMVDSYRDPGVQYAVNSTCACQDALHKAPAGWCSHKIAVDLVRACPPEPGAAACPEAAFSLCLRGLIGGLDAQLTIRGQDAATFRANVDAMRGLLEAVPPAASRTREPGEEAETKPTCPAHGITMKESTKAPGTFYCPKRLDGSDEFCKARWPAKGQPR